MTDFPDVKLKAQVSFPARVDGGAGIDVVKSNGNYTFDLAFDDFAPPVGSISDAAHQNALLWNSATGSYTLAPMALLSGGSLPEAPNTGLQYARQSLGWTQIVTPAVPTPSVSLPLVDGTAAPGAAATYSRGDHVHPLAPNNFLQAGTGAVTRTMQDKARDVVSVKDFGAIGNGVADDTAAIQAAITYAISIGGAEVRMPTGNYKTTSTIILSAGSGVSLVGDGTSNTYIKPNFVSGDVIVVSGSTEGYSVIGITFEPSVVKTSGAIIDVQGIANLVHIFDIYIKNGYDGVWFDTSGVVQKLDNFYIASCSHAGVVIGSSTRQAIDVTLTRGNTSLCGNGLLLLNVSGLFSALVDYVLCTGNAIQFAPPSGASTIFCFFDQVLADTPSGIGWAFPATVGKVGNIICTNCWAAGATSAGLAGILIDNTNANGITWANGHIRNNNKHGIQINLGTNITVTGSQIFNNSVGGSAASHGIVIGPTAVDVTITDNRIGGGGFDALSGSTNFQGYGILIQAGATKFVIHGNDLNGNVTGGLSDGTIAATPKTITGNLGYVTEARGTATVLSGNAAVAVTHGLSGTPTAIVCTMLDTGGGAQAGGANMPRVASVGSTSFTFDIGVLASANRPFSWMASL